MPGLRTVVKGGAGSYTVTFPNALIMTADSAGAAADRAFDMVVFAPGGLVAPRPAAKGAASDEGGRR
jgi:hypothetical protein